MLRCERKNERKLKGLLSKARTNVGANFVARNKEDEEENF